MVSDLITEPGSGHGGGKLQPLTAKPVSNQHGTSSDGEVDPIHGACVYQPPGLGSWVGRAHTSVSRMAHSLALPFFLFKLWRKSSCTKRAQTSFWHKPTAKTNTNSCEIHSFAQTWDHQDDPENAFMTVLKIMIKMNNIMWKRTWIHICGHPNSSLWSPRAQQHREAEKFAEGHSPGCKTNTMNTPPRAHSTPATEVFLLFPEHTTFLFTSGPLHWLFSLADTFFFNLHKTATPYSRFTPKSPSDRSPGFSRSVTS